MMHNLISYFGFSRTPFGRDLAPSMLHRHSTHNEAVARIGWCIADRRIGAALNLLHKDVAANWTVETLAAAAGMSRSAFALRFKEKVGQSPLDYLTRWRMFRAGHLLRNSDKALVEIAGSVGYDSEAAFNKAFKRTTGSAPGAYRRSMRSAAVAGV